MINVEGLTLTTDPVDKQGRPLPKKRAVILDDVTFSVAPGETVLLTGCSGSGKTSLLRVLNGLIPHIMPGRIEGTVTVAGQVPGEVELSEAGAVSASVFQNPRTQFFATDVLSEVSFAAANREVPREEILTRIARVGPEMGIEHLLGRRMSQLSGGQCQRVAIASAVVGQPEVFLLDEPTANLDDASAQHTAEVIAGLRRGGATILIAEHRMHHLKGLVDRVVEMAGGRVVRDMPAEEFWALGDNARVSAGLRCFEPPQPSAPAPPAVNDAGGVVLRDFEVPGLWCIGEARFPRGHVTCVTGSNGAGKSTLVRSIVGLQAAKGTVELDGRRLSAAQRRARCFAVMQDVNRQLFAGSVDEELRLARGTRRAVKPGQFDALLAQLGLEGMGERHPLSLSGGQKQRLAVATARAAGAEVIAFDEPTSGLDLRFMRQMGEVIRGCAAAGAVVLVVTHDRELIEEIGDAELRLTECD